MSKPTKPQWATNNPLQVIEPNLAKKQTGWLPGEKPPNQFFNWLLLKLYEWVNWFESKAENIEPVLFRSNSPVGWDGATLTFPAPIDLIFRVVTGPSQINRFLAGNLAFADGEVLVLKRDKTGPSPVTVVAGVYGALTPGQYAIIPEGNLTGADVENEMIVFRRRGAELEIPYLGVILPVDASYHIGISDDHGILEGLGDDDHPQYVHKDIARTITAKHSFSPNNPQAPFDLGANAQGQKVTGLDADLLDDQDGSFYQNAGNLNAGVLADARVQQSNVTQHNGALDHGLLQGLGDDDHSQYAHLNKGGQTFLQKLTHPSTGGGDPGTTIATKDYVDGKVLSDHGSLGGLGDDDHPQYLHLNKGGQTIQQDVAVAGGKTIDGVDISNHTHDYDSRFNAGHFTNSFNYNGVDLSGTVTHNVVEPTGAPGTASSNRISAIQNIDWNAGDFDGDNRITITDSSVTDLGGSRDFDFDYGVDGGGESFDVRFVMLCIIWIFANGGLTSVPN